MQKSLPKITYCIITYNEEKRIKDCLYSVFNQDYPKNLLEVILVDDNSTDNTVEIAKKFPVKILINGKKDADLSITMGFKAATGEFFGGFGADMQPRGKGWFYKMVKPLMENSDMAFAVTKFYPHPKDSLINRYINLDPLQRDLVYQTFSIGFDDVPKEKKDGYFICKYSSGKIPPQSHGLYRVKVMGNIIKEQKVWYDMGNLVLLVKNNYSNVGYVPDAGFYHFHADNLKHLLGKRVRNIQRSYLRYNELRSHYKWVDFTKKTDRIKLAVLVISANLFLPIFLYSLYRMFKYKRWEYLIEAPVTFLLVDTIIVTFIKFSRGRKFIKETLMRF